MRLAAASAYVLLSTFASAQQRIPDVIYMKQGGCAFTMDVFTPKTSNHKAIMFLISGGWVSSHEGINPGIAGVLNAKGYTVFEVVHGAAPRFVVSEIVPMIRRAVRFVRANADKYQIDPDAIGLTGISSGGHLTLETAGLGDDGDPNAKDPIDRVSSRVNAAVAFMPPTDFRNWGAANTLASSNPQLQIFLPAMKLTPQSSEDEKKRVADQISPATLVITNFPPTLLIHGDKDTLVPVQQSQEMDGLFEKAKVTHKLVVVAGGGHDGVTVMKGLPEAIAWFDTQLKPKP